MRAILATLALPWLLASPAQAGERYVYDPETLIGQVHKPQVMMVITRQNLNEAFAVELRESFLPRIAEATEKGPF
ncbi:MAG: hypothetical protein ABIO70_17555 [Pseudomonadota bacterium]